MPGSAARFVLGFVVCFRYRLWGPAGWGSGPGRCARGCPECPEGNASSRSLDGGSWESQRSPPCLRCPSGTLCRRCQMPACQGQTPAPAGWHRWSVWTWDSSGWAAAEWPHQVGPGKQVYIINCSSESTRRRFKWRKVEYWQEVQEVLVLLFLPLVQLLPKSSRKRKEALHHHIDSSLNFTDTALMLAWLLTDAPLAPLIPWGPWKRCQTLIKRLQWQVSGAGGGRMTSCSWNKTAQILTGRPGGPAGPRGPVPPGSPCVTRHENHFHKKRVK